MEDEKRRKLDELVARYELEPSLHDVYVEGLTDKSIIQWFLDESNLDTKNCTVYEIDTVDIPNDQLCELGLNNGNRSRVIFLAFQLQRLFETTSLPHVVCIADRDFDDLIGSSSIESELLLFTDYTSIEMYLFDSNIIEKFLRLAVRKDDLKAVNIIKNISPILEEIFLFRAANQSLSDGMEWLSSGVKGCLKKRRKGDPLEFDSDFVEKYLNKNKRSSEKIAFLDKVNELRNKNISEIRNKIRGHDFIELFCWYIEPYLPKNKKWFSEPEIVLGTLLCCLDVDYLMEEKLFQDLTRRMSK